MQRFTAEAFEDTADPALVEAAALAAERRQRSAAEGAVAKCRGEGLELGSPRALGLLAEGGASLRALRLAREARGSERVLNLLMQIMQDPHLALFVGSLVGIPTALQYGAASREHGAVIRDIVPKLFATATPHVYVCGGASIFRGGVLSTVSRFDAAAGTWQSMPSMATARRLCTATTVGNSLYVIGGEYEVAPVWHSDVSWRSYQQVSTVERFDVFTMSWSTVEDMPTARAGCAAASQAGLVYVFGGRVAEEVGALAERLDTALGRWERLPSLPSARSGCAAATLLGVLYVIGGKGLDGQILAAVERFDPCCGWWQVLPPMPSPRSACACGVLQGRLFVAGGFSGMDGLDTIDAFDPVAGHWEAMPPMRTRRIGAACVGAGGKLYILGGKTEGDFALRCESMDPLVGSWEWLPPMSERHVYCAAGALVGCG